MKIFFITITILTTLSASLSGDFFGSMLHDMREAAKNMGDTTKNIVSEDVNRTEKEKTK